MVVLTQLTVIKDKNIFIVIGDVCSRMVIHQDGVCSS